MVVLPRKDEKEPATAILAGADACSSTAFFALIGTSSQRLKCDPSCCVLRAIGTLDAAGGVALCVTNAAAAQQGGREHIAKDREIHMTQEEHGGGARSST